MGAVFDVIKTLIVPALISLLIFLLSSYVLVPLWQRYRNRYSQYLPLETISNQTSSFRARVQNGVARMMVPSAWRARLQDRLVIARSDSTSDAGYDSDEGEELSEVDEEARRELSRSIDRRRHGVDNTRRLSRDLEAGFRDDSYEESDTSGSRR